MINFLRKIRRKRIIVRSKPSPSRDFTWVEQTINNPYRAVRYGIAKIPCSVNQLNKYPVHKGTSFQWLTSSLPTSCLMGQIKMRSFYDFCLQKIDQILLYENQNYRCPTQSISKNLIITQSASSPSGEAICIELPYIYRLLGR